MREVVERQGGGGDICFVSYGGKKEWKSVRVYNIIPSKVKVFIFEIIKFLQFFLLYFFR